MLKTALKHNLRIRRYKKIIAALGLLTFAAIFIFPWYNSLSKYNAPAEKHNSINTKNNNELTKVETPKFYGKDHKEQPFTITAAQGVEKSKGLMELDNVWADLKMQDKTHVQLSSKLANIHTDIDRLDLMGDVNIIASNGYTLNTNSAGVYYKDKSVTGNEPVTVSGNMGNISAPAFKVTPDMQTVIFYNGRVHTTLYGNKKNENE